MESKFKIVILAALFFLCASSVEAVEPRWVSVELKTDLGCKVNAAINRQESVLEMLELSCKKKIKVPLSRLWRTSQVDLSKMKIDVSPSLTEIDGNSGEVILSGHYVRISIPQVVENNEVIRLIHFVFSEERFVESYVENIANEDRGTRN